MQNLLKTIEIKLFDTIPSKWKEFLMIITFLLKYPSRIKKNINYTKKSLVYLKKSYPKLYYKSKKALWNYCFRQIDNEKFKIYLDTYLKQGVECIQKNISTELAYDDPILICAVKDDLQRVKLQVEHHKKIGIDNFIYIDNLSTDGTYEWLIEQGIDVYRTRDSFSATAKMAWFRQITDTYGYDRWYLILDSDEMFAYPGMETGDIQNLVSFSEKKKMQFVQSFMIDMYSKKNINQEIPSDFKLENYDIKNENCYFDKNSYSIKKSYKGIKIVGGPRARVFSDDNFTFTPLLTKNSLVYLQKEKIYGMHYSLPYHENFKNPIISGLLHYKFLPTDNEKYARIAKDENYAGGSSEYKQYIKKLKENPEIYFYSSNSGLLSNSSDLMKINIFNKSVSLELMYFLKNAK